ncbi:hypothetical protein [Bowmanella yangjiangensis]|uniref:Uncharacterized protein n=1 Tax=Bowmanella yangjiangensis TaxID=2811230 RepID=A0ABS3CNH8_9ALTE|nr:hypothetical protein [Bowmanella yangjiangensis]MBN7818659.1 hypothetical protein [Bowmanella yangjiangensis]
MGSNKKKQSSAGDAPDYNDIPTVLTVMAFSLALMLALIWLGPGNNRWWGSWFQPFAALALTMIGLLDVIKAKTVEGKIKPLIVTLISLGLCLAAFYGTIRHG